MELLLRELSELAVDFDGVFLVELAMLCVLMVVGLYVVYTDLCFRDVPPVAVWTLLGAGAAGQLALWALGQTDLAQVGQAVGAGLIVSYVLYVYGFWAPGDAKLFWGLAVAFPPTLSLTHGLLSLDAPLWALLINAVLVNCLFLVAWVLPRRWRKRDDRPALPGAAFWLGLGRDMAAVTGLVAGGGLLLLGESLDFAAAAMATVVGGSVWQRLVPASQRGTVPMVREGLWPSAGRSRRTRRDSPCSANTSNRAAAMYGRGTDWPWDGWWWRCWG